LWDPLEPSRGARLPASKRIRRAASPAPTDALRAELQAERKARQAPWSRFADLPGLAQLGTRVALVEEQVRLFAAAVALAVRGDRARSEAAAGPRRFAETERVLQDPLVQNDAVLQFRLGQALSSAPDPDGSRSSRAEAAFRRAAELDAAWPEPRARLSALLLAPRQAGRSARGAPGSAEIGPGCRKPWRFFPWSAARPCLPLSCRAAPAPWRRPCWCSPCARRSPSPRFRSPKQVARCCLYPRRPSRRPSARSSSSASQVRRERSATSRTRPGPSLPDPTAAADRGRIRPRIPASHPRARPDGHSRRRRTRAGGPPGPEPRSKKVASTSRVAAEAESAKGDKALRAFDTNAAEAAFASALKLDPTLRPRTVAWAWSSS